MSVTLSKEAHEQVRQSTPRQWWRSLRVVAVAATPSAATARDASASGRATDGGACGNSIWS